MVPERIVERVLLLKVVLLLNVVLLLKLARLLFSRLPERLKVVDVPLS